jgi:hypothetical protein
MNSTKTSATMSDLTNEQSYTFTVVATNSAGNSSPSAASAAITPTLPKCAPGFGYFNNGISGASIGSFMNKEDASLFIASSNEKWRSQSDFYTVSTGFFVYFCLFM